MENEQIDEHVSWLASSRVKLENLQWREDELGVYWFAEAWMAGETTRMGFTGSYYDILEDGKRPTRAEQEIELKGWGKL